MASTTTYKTLFQISILHGYFLNSGNTEFDDLTDDKQKLLLKSYSIEDFLEIIPTQETKKQLKNNHIIYNNKGSIFRFGVKISPTNSNKPFLDISLDLTLNFLIRIKDYAFENYTNISFLKKQLLCLSNIKPTSEPITFKYFPLSDDAIFVDDDFLVSEETTTAILKTIEDSEKLGVFGIISLKMQGDDDDLNILSDDTELLNPTPIFKIHFDNRKTYWKYKKTNGSFEVETSSEQPLTKNGFIEIDPLTDFTTNPPEATDYKYPNPSAKSINKTGGKTYSEVFI